MAERCEEKFCDRQECTYYESGQSALKQTSVPDHNMSGQDEQVPNQGTPWTPEINFSKNEQKWLAFLAAQSRKTS